MLFFPEGPRSWDGRLRPFERGPSCSRCACACRSSVGISGTRQVLPRGRLAVTPGRITVRYGAPVDATTYGLERKAELIDEVRHRIAEVAGLPLEK